MVSMRVVIYWYKVFLRSSNWVVIICVLTKLEKGSASGATAAKMKVCSMHSSSAMAASGAPEKGLENLVGINVTAISVTVAFKVVHIVSVVVSGPLFRIGQDAVGLADFFEFPFMLLLFIICGSGMTI